jgi:hypothetical protein
VLGRRQAQADGYRQARAWLQHLQQGLQQRLVAVRRFNKDLGLSGFKCQCLQRLEALPTLAGLALFLQT